MPNIGIDIKDTSSIRLRPLTSSLTGSSQTYSSLAADEIESANDYETPVDRRGFSTQLSRWTRTPKQIVPEVAWIHRYFWADTWNDVKRIPLGWLARRFVSHFLPLSVIACLTWLVTIMWFQISPFAVDAIDVCSPDGSFELSSDSYDQWGRNATFTIDVSFGSFSFGVAKLIDICWDVGVARGGQALLAFYSYLAFTKALSRTMENSTVTHGTFSAITLQHNTTSSLLILVRDLFKTGGYRAKLALAWTIFAASFVLFSTTWLSAMTGYTADITPYVRDQENIFVPIGMFQPVIYTIADASRFNNGFEDNHHVVVPWDDSTTPSLEPGYGCYALSYDDTSPGTGSINFTFLAEDYLDNATALDCKWMYAVSKYVYDWGFWATSSKRNTTFEMPDESNLTTAIFFDPPLNITTYSTNYGSYDGSDYTDGWWYFPYGPSWRNPDTHEQPFNQSNPAFWYNSSQTLYNLSELNSQGSCLPDGAVTYQWGFSFILLFGFAVAFLIWCIGTWILYLDSWLHSGLDLSHRHMGLERAVVDMARSLDTRLATDQIELQSNSQIKSLLQGSRITYSDFPLQDTRWSKLRLWWRDFNFRRWIMDEKWWLLALLTFTVMWGVTVSQRTKLTAGWVPDLSFLPWLGVLVVLALGRDVRSRWLLFVLFFSVFWAFNAWWMTQYKQCQAWCWLDYYD